MAFPERNKKEIQKNRNVVVFIYGLCCPYYGNLKYIGKTSLNLKRRLGLHINKSNKSKSKNSIWISTLIKNGEKPVIVLLETTTSNLASHIERKWIYKLGLDNLFNGNIGGGGGNCEGLTRNNSYISRFNGFLKDSKYSNNSKKNYSSYFLKFINHFKNQVLSPKEINSNQIQEYIDQFTNKSTRNAHIVALKVFYKEIMNQPLKLKNIQYEYF